MESNPELGLAGRAAASSVTPRLLLTFGVLLFSLALWGQSSAGSALEARVRALYDEGHWAEAAALASSAPAPSASILLYEGLALARLNQLSQASGLFQQAGRMFPRDKRFPLESAGIAYREKNFKGAKRLLHRALRLDPEDSYGNDFLATLYLLDGNLPAALQFWNRIHKPFLADVQFQPEPPLNPILRERVFDFSPGQVLTLEQLRIMRANLARVRVLTDVKVDLAPADERFDLAIRSAGVSQAFRGWPGRVLPMLRSLPYQGIDIDFLNIQRRGINFASLERWDSNKRRLALDISGPLRMNPKIEYHYLLDARDERWNLQGTYHAGSTPLTDVILRRIEAGGYAEIGLSSRLQWTTGAKAAYRRFRNGDQSWFFLNGWTAELTNRLDYLLLDSPDRRLSVTSWIVLNTGRVLTSSPSRLITMQGGLHATWHPQSAGDRYTVTLSTQSGASYGNLPLDELFTLGMERDNPIEFWFRGLTADRNGKKGAAPMGTEYGLVQAEVDRKVFEFPFIRLDAGPFFDSGKVSTPSALFGSANWLYATGLEAKLRSIGGVEFRFVCGFDLNRGRGVFYSAVSR